MLKSIRISGFRSYKSLGIDKKIVFDKNCNLVLGPNGTGKSNFFSAIQFVISGAYTSLDRSKTEEYLHEGVGRQILSAYVELEFENSPPKFPIDAPIVTLRRSIGLNKDEYHLNGVSTKKSEIASFLEYAGFSPSNPFYVVSQGKVTDFATLTPEKRLDLFRQVSGTLLYDQQRGKTTFQLEEARNHISSLKKIQTFIDNRIIELEAEKVELEAYEKIKTKQRALQGKLYSLHLSTLQKSYHDIESEQKKSILESQNAAIVINHLTERIQTLEQDLESLDIQISQEKETIKSIIQEKDNASHQKFQLLGDIEDMEDEDVESLSAQLSLYTTQIASSTEKLDNIHNELESLLQQKKQLITQIERDETHLTMFAGVSPQEWVETKKTELVTKKNLLSETLQIITQLSSKLSLPVEETENDDSLESEESEESLPQQLERFKDIARKLSEKHESLKDSKISLMTQKFSVSNNLRTTQDNLRTSQASLDMVSSSLFESRRSLYSILPNNISTGLTVLDSLFHISSPSSHSSSHSSSILSVSPEEAAEITDKMAHVYGPLYKLFTIDPKYLRVCETSAKNQLFHVVVSDEKIGGWLISKFEKYGGRLSVIPLNRITPKYIGHNNSSNCISIPPNPDIIALVDKLDPTIPEALPALQMVFGRILVCRDLLIASNYSKKYRITGITLGCDLVDQDGLVTGGFHEASSLSRLQTWCIQKRWIKEHAALIQSHSVLQIKFNQLSLEATDLDNSLSKVEQNLTNSSSEMSDAQFNISTTLHQISKCKSQLSSLKTNVSLLESQISNLNQNILLTTTSQSPIDDPNSLSTQIAQAKQKLDTVNSNYNSLLKTQSSLFKIHDTLHDTICRIEILLPSAPSGSGFVSVSTDQEVEGEPESLSSGNSSIPLEAIQRIDSVIQDLTKTISLHEEKLEKLLHKRETLSEDINSSKNESKSKKFDPLSSGSHIDTLLSTKNSLIVQIEHLQKQIASLSLSEIPKHVFNSIPTTVPSINKALKQVSTSLEKYSHINSKALDQYLSLSSQQTDIHSQISKLEETETSVLSLLSHLDIQKEQALERTLNLANKYFQSFFATLVPEGSCSLAMSTTGIEIKVSFTSKIFNNLSPIFRSSGSVGSNIQSRSRSSSLAESTESEGESSESTLLEEGLDLNFDTDDSNSNENTNNLNQEQFTSLSSLSGGQRTIVAISLLMALQQVDPVPFYILDEIDAALDKVFRAAVAKLIYTISHGEFQHIEHTDSGSGSGSKPNSESQQNLVKSQRQTQFFCTTFHPELVSIADCIFSVSFKNRVSNLHPITQDSAISFCKINRPMTRFSTPNSLEQREQESSVLSPTSPQHT